MTITNTQGYAIDADGQWWKLFKGGRRTRATLKTCPQCGNQFPSWKAERVLCSQRCAGRSKRVPDSKKACAWCGEMFTSREPEQRFCSHKCAALLMHDSRNPTTVHDGEGLVHSNDPRYTQDGKGQWWYHGTTGRTRAHIKACEVCGKDFLCNLFRKRTRTCSGSCGAVLFHRERPGHSAGERSTHWKGGKTNRRGYTLAYAPSHPSLAGTTRKYVLEHRLVMEKMIGRLMETYETVHHKNGDRADNSPENLELWIKAHPAGQRWANEAQKHCPTCTCHQR